MRIIAAVVNMFRTIFVAVPAFRRVDPAITCAEVKRQAEAKIADIEGKIASLLGMKKALVREI